MPTPLIPLPTTTDMLAAVGGASSPVFNAMLPIGLLGAGFIIGGLIVFALMSWISRGISVIIHGNPDRYD